MRQFYGDRIFSDCSMCGRPGAVTIDGLKCYPCREREVEACREARASTTALGIVLGGTILMGFILLAIVWASTYTPLGK